MFKTWATLEGLLLFVSVVIVIVAGSYHLSESPAVWYDEGFYTQAAMNLAEHGVQELQVAPNTFTSGSYLTVGYPLLFPVSLSYRLFGVGVLQGRAVMFLFILAFAAASYALVRMLFGRPLAAWALLLLVSFPILYGDGKSILGEVPGMLFFILTCIALVKLEKSNYQSAWAYIGAGVAAGLCVVTKPIFILLLPALALTWIIRRRSISVHFGGFVLAVAAFLLPVLLWIHIQFGGDTSFAKQLSYYVASPYPIPDRLALAIGNVKKFFTEVTPLYTALTIMLWSASLYLRKKRGAAISTVEVFMLVFCFFILGAFLRIQGWYRYFFPAEIVALLFVPHSLTVVFEYVSEKIPLLRKALWLPGVVLTVLIVGQLYQLAHGSYVAGYYHSTNTADLYQGLGTLSPQSDFFLANVPELAVFLPSRNYYQYIDAAPGLRIGADQVPVLQNGTAQYVLVTPATYQNNPELFTRYVLQSQISKYLLLVKK